MIEGARWRRWVFFNFPLVMFIVGFFVLPALVYRIVGTVQDGGNAPAVAALNTWHTLVSWAHHKARHLQRPERFDGTTRIVRDP